MVSAFIPLAPGEAGVRQIVANLERLAAYYGARPVIREVAARVASSFDDNSLAYHVRKLADFVKSRVIYVRDPVGAEFVKTPDRMLLDIARSGNTEGDCDDHVLLFSALAQSLGIPVRIAAVKIPPSPVFNHVIAVVDLDGRAVEIDLCAKGVTAPDYPEKLFVTGSGSSGGVGCMACAASPAFVGDYVSAQQQFDEMTVAAQRVRSAAFDRDRELDVAYNASFFISDDAQRAAKQDEIRAAKQDNVADRDEQVSQLSTGVLGKIIGGVGGALSGLFGALINAATQIGVAYVQAKLQRGLTKQQIEGQLAVAREAQQGQIAQLQAQIQAQRDAGASQLQIAQLQAQETAAQQRLAELNAAQRLVQHPEYTQLFTDVRTLNQQLTDVRGQLQVAVAAGDTAKVTQLRQQEAAILADIAAKEKRMAEIAAALNQATGATNTILTQRNDALTELANVQAQLAQLRANNGDPAQIAALEKKQAELLQRVASLNGQLATAQQNIAGGGGSAISAKALGWGLGLGAGALLLIVLASSGSRPRKSKQPATRNR